MPSERSLHSNHTYYRPQFHLGENFDFEKNSDLDSLDSIDTSISRSYYQNERVPIVGLGRDSAVSVCLIAFFRCQAPGHLSYC